MQTIEDIRNTALNHASGLPNIFTAKDLIRESIAIEAYLLNRNKSKELTREDLYGSL